MATRDRTPSFILLKTEYKNRRPNNINNNTIINKENSSNYETLEEENINGMVPLVPLNNKNNNFNNNNNNDNNVPAWLLNINDIDLNLSKISTSIEKLKGFHDKNLLPDMSAEDQSDAEKSIEIITAETTRLFHKTHEMIKSLGGKGTILTQEDLRVKKNIQSSKLSKLQSLSVLFRQKQRKYLTALQKRSSNSFNDLYNKGYHNEGGEDDDEDDDNNFMKEIFDFTDDQKRIVDMMEEEITQRDKDIKKILNSINDLTNLFQDISLLVVQQGTILDRIDYNLNQTEAFVQEADKEIEITNEYHKEYRTRLCILMILVALVVAMVFIFILRLVF